MSENLKQLKEDLISGKEATNTKFIQALGKVIDNGESVYIPCKREENSDKIIIYNDYGLNYIELFTDPAMNRYSVEVISADINEIIDILYENKNLNGIVFDADNGKLEITREQISECSNRIDPRLEPKNWGVGIPKYEPNDIMTDDEIFSMGMDTTISYLIDNGYKVLDVINNYRIISNILAVKDNQKYVIDIDTTIAPNIPQQSIEDKNKLIKFCQDNASIPLYVPISYGSSDRERLAKKLALVGDEFYCNFSGVRKV